MRGWRRGNRDAGDVFVDDAGFHYKNYATDGGDVFCRVTVEGDEVCLEARGDGADLIGHAKRFCAEGVGGDHGGHGLDSAIADAVDEVFGVAAVDAGYGIGTVNNF